MINVVFIAYYFPPVGGAGVQRSQKFTQYLPNEGFLPIVLTGPGSNDGRWVPHDASLMASISPDISIYRAKGSVNAASSVRRRLQNWLDLPSEFSKWWVRSAAVAATEITDHVDLIFATMSPFSSCEIAIGLSELLRVPWVADLRDPWALDEMQVYPTLLHKKLEMGRMRKSLSTAAMIIMNTPEACAALVSAFPEFKGKNVCTITNGYDHEDFANVLEPRSDQKFRIVHSGYLHANEGFRRKRQGVRRYLGGAAPGIDVLTRSHVFLLEAIERWRLTRPEVNKDLEIVFVGETSATDRSFALKSSVDRFVQFTGYLPHVESLTYVRTADLLFLPMHNLPTGIRSTIIPGKTYEYMSTGRPILAAVPDGDANDFLRQCGTALVCRPDDIEGMVRILDVVYDAWKKGTLIGSMNEDFVKQFERHNLTRALASAFKSVIGSGSQKVAVSL